MNVQEMAGARALDGNVNHRPVVLRHDLCDHPLFSLKRLAALAKDLQAANPALILHRAAEDKVNTDITWGNFDESDDIGSTIESIERSKAWIDILDTDRDPDYRDLRDELVAEVSRLVGRDLVAEGVWATGHIFIASPHSVTHCHIDSETNFLFVIRGDKTLRVTQRDLLLDDEIERFYWGDINAVRHRKAFDATAETFHLKAGDCLHIPVNAPHWVNNGPEPCIAYSLLMYLPENIDRAHAFQVNRCLRAMGFAPPAIGRFPRRDKIKASLLGALSRRVSRNKFDVIHSARASLTSPLRLVRKLRSSVTRSGLPIQRQT